MQRRCLTRGMTGKQNLTKREGRSTIFLAAASFSPYLEIIYRIQSRLSLSAEVDGHRFKTTQTPLYPQSLARRQSESQATHGHRLPSEFLGAC